MLILNAPGTEGIHFSYEESFNTKFGKAAEDAIRIGKSIINDTLADDSILYAIAPLKGDVGHVIVYTLNETAQN